jgi:hypothetical protein
MQFARLHGPGEARSLRRAVALVTALACLRPALLVAAPAEPSAGGAADVPGLFRRGKAQQDRGEFLEAARTLVQATVLLPIDDVDNRRSLFGHIARAYKQAADAEADADALREIVDEAVRVLDEYAAAFTGAFPNALLAAGALAIHAQLRARQSDSMLMPVRADNPPPALDDRTTDREDSPPLLKDDPPEPKSQPAPTSDPEPPKPAPRPRKGLLIAGGVTTGGSVAMLGVFIGGLVRVRSIEGQLPEINDKSTWNDLRSRGDRADRLATAGIVAAPILLAAGIAMLVVARRKPSRHALTPVLHPAMTGAVLQLRF